MADLPGHITAAGGFEAADGRVYVPYSPMVEAAIRQSSGYRTAPVGTVAQQSAAAAGNGYFSNPAPAASPGGITPFPQGNKVEKIGERLYLIDQDTGRASLLADDSASAYGLLGYKDSLDSAQKSRQNQFDAEQKQLDRESDLEKLAVSRQARQDPQWTPPSTIRGERGEVDVYDPNSGGFYVARQSDPEASRIEGGNLIIPEGRTAQVYYPGRSGAVTLSGGPQRVQPDRQLPGTLGQRGGGGGQGGGQYSRGGGAGGGGARGGGGGPMGGAGYGARGALGPGSLPALPPSPLDDTLGWPDQAPVPEDEQAWYSGRIGTGSPLLNNFMPWEDTRNRGLGSPWFTPDDAMAPAPRDIPYFGVNSWERGDWMQPTETNDWMY